MAGGWLESRQHDGRGSLVFSLLKHAYPPLPITPSMAPLTEEAHDRSLCGVGSVSRTAKPRSGVTSAWPTLNCKERGLLLPRIPIKGEVVLQGVWVQRWIKRWPTSTPLPPSLPRI